MDITYVYVWLIWGIGLTISTLLGSLLVKKYRDTLGYPTLVAIYITYILSSNFITSRISMYNIFITLILPGATLIFPFTAQAIDMINEIYGRRKAYLSILLAFTGNVLASSFVVLISLVPPAPWLENYDPVWKFFFLQTPRIVVASYTAFIVSQITDATVFARIKRWLYKKEINIKTLTLGGLFRAVTSDSVDMTVDSLIFVPMAFAFVVPHEALFSLMLDTIYTKILISIIDKPWFVVFRLLTKEVKRDL